MWCGNHLTTVSATMVCTNVLCYMRGVKQLVSGNGYNLNNYKSKK